MNFKSLEVDQQFEINEAFSLFKNDNNECNKVKHALRALGLEPDKKDISDLIATTTKEQISISVSSFRELAAKLITKRDSNSSMDYAFKLFDKDNSGKISFSDLKAIATTLGEDVSDHHLELMIQMADSNGDGLVDKNEFISLMTTKKML
ncbi:centrin [Heterostelium album PN500]|uniref:Centrin n=1 Tax=Heterostelium pallidum (strain ATCC 26659 / Pp 5 / PN500) TaxID=670386 RepID=D3BMW5_HETP5|nr:centrin [Heterostelium album PN500]EFA77327.1 centrin [Heterostelium album PN500]|eukprot:XP_020429456.1 centrin [Heterostelium album PN500]